MIDLEPVMDKILAVLKQAGMDEGQIKLFEEATAEHKKALHEDYLRKVEHAKKVCLEESEKHKAELARRVQIWCEAQVSRVDRKLQNQSAIKESAALTKLEKVKALLEGIELNGATNVELQSEVKQLQEKVKSLTEESQRQKTIITRQTSIADNALRRNRLLESKLGTKSVVAESKGAVVTEGKQPQKIVRKIAAPATTRRTLQESQTRAPQKLERKGGSDWDIGNIAQQITE